MFTLNIYLSHKTNRREKFILGRTYPKSTPSAGVGGLSSGSIKKIFCVRWNSWLVLRVTVTTGYPICNVQDRRIVGKSRGGGGSTPSISACWELFNVRLKNLMIIIWNTAEKWHHNESWTINHKTFQLLIYLITNL